MNVEVKEDIKMENAAKSYLQSYQEFVMGYKQFKLEKAKLLSSAEKTQHEEKSLLQ